MAGTNYSDNAIGNGGSINHFLTNDKDQYILVQGTIANLPSGTANYAVGCEYQATDTGNHYINKGSATSCSFVLVDTGTAYSTTTTSLGTAQNSTPTAAQLLGGIVTQTSATGAGTVTLPTGTVLSAAITGVATGYTFDCIFANLGGGQTLTITAGASGITVIGTATVASGTNVRLTFVNTAANTWNCYTNK